MSNKVVHCKSQQEWDFVIDNSISKVDKSAFVNKDNYNSGGNCIDITSKYEFCYLNYYKENNYKILSFEDWCKENNYTLDWLKKSKDTLLEEAKRRYPVGTKFKDHTIQKIWTIKNTNFIYSNDYINNLEAIYLESKDIVESTESRWAICLDGKWAEIVEDTKPQFEVGKWYIINSDNSRFINVVKIKKVFSNTKIEAENGYYNIKSDNGGCRWNATTNKHVWEDINKVTPLTLEDVQQYLPGTHPDIIDKPLPKTVEKWSKGTYVVYLEKFSNLISKNQIDKITTELKPGYLGIYTKCYGFLILTREQDGQIKWFATKEEAEKFVKLQQSIIPEYVECISSWIGSLGNSIKGKIYKTSVQPDFTANKWESILLPSHFKPSTKEAYEAQEKWIPKVGDWVVITKSDTNWVDEMDDFVGKCVRISNIIIDDEVIFQGNGKWSWIYSDGHFRKALPHEIPIFDVVEVKHDRDYTIEQLEVDTEYVRSRYSTVDYSIEDSKVLIPKPILLSVKDEEPIILKNPKPIKSITTKLLVIEN